MKIKDIMETDVVTVRLGTKLAELFVLMSKYRITEFPVVDDDYRLQGIVYERDMLAALYPKYDSFAFGLPDFSDMEVAAFAAKDDPVEKIMTKDVPTAQPEAEVMKIGAKMLVDRIARMPVVSDRKIVGVITQSKIFVEVIRMCLTQEPKTDRRIPGKEAETRQRTGVARPSEKFSGAESRLFKRFQVNMRVAYKMNVPVTYQLTKAGDLAASSGKGRLATAVNISRGGLLLQCDEELPLHALLDLAFDLSSGQDQPIKRLGRVMRCVHADKPGIYEAGIMFLAMTPAEISQIQRYLSQMDRE